MYVTVKNLSNVFTLDINYWDIIIMDYSGKGKGKEAESTGGLRWLSAPRPLAARTPAPSRLPRAGAPSAAATPSGGLRISMTRLQTPRIGGAQLVRNGGGIGRSMGGRIFVGGPVRPVPVGF